MKKYFLLLYIVFASSLIHAQILQPASWELSTSKEQVSIGEEIDLIFTVNVDTDWYIYSSDFDPDLGPMLTEFLFEEHSSFELIGEIKPINPSEKYDEIWEGNVRYFKDQGEFRQKVRITGDNPQIKGSYAYQVCSDIDGKCIPFEEDFEFTNLKVVESEASSGLFEAQTLELPGSTIADANPGILTPVSWEIEFTSEAEVGEETEITFSALIDPQWYLYSSDVDLAPGPLPATFSFEGGTGYELIEEIMPIGAEKKYDEIFSGEVSYFSGTAEFRQKVKILSEDFSIVGNIDYQVCSDIDLKCVSLEEDFSLPQDRVQQSNIGTPPETQKVGLLQSRDSISPYSMLSFMLVAFLAGLAALLTPCVFPMIPMTVSFFTGKSGSNKKGIRNALLYGASIILIYSTIGTVIAPFMGPEMANELATNWIPNVLFFIVFVVFALSFFGLV